MGKRRKNEEQIPTSVYDTDAQDEELKASYDGQGLDSGSKPAFLYVEKGPGAGQLVPVRQGVLVIGRASVSDLRLQHPSISRRHSQLTRRGERFFFKDLSSQNGSFVNKERIETEVELSPGDSIGMGNALLKLRGPLAKNETVVGSKDRLKAQAKSVPTAVVLRPRTSGVAKVAMFAGAVGFGLCAVLAFALVRSSAPKGTKAEAKKEKVIVLPEQPVAKQASRRFQAEPATDEIEIAAGPVAVTRERRIDDAIEKKMAERQAANPPPKPTEPPKAEAVAVETRKDAVEAKKEPEVKKDKAPIRAAGAGPAPREVAVKEKEEAPPPKTTPKRSAILASYEKGDAEGSLDAAKEAGDKALATQLARFVDTYDQAEAAFDKNNAKLAIDKYQDALAQDEKISGGFGKYGAEIRKRLATIYLLAGNQFAKSGQTDNARTALQASLKYEPSNAKAKSALKALEDDGSDEATPEPKKATASKKTAAAADDGSSEDDEADAKPVKKTASKKSAEKEKPAAKTGKSSRSAIDDAFGD